MATRSVVNPSQPWVRSVDDFSTPNQYHVRMRRFWLSFLTAFALAASGVSPVMAMQDCPMRAEAAQAVAHSAPAHDCCPDQEKSDDGQGQQQHDLDGCLMGMACRTAPAVAPCVAPIVLPAAAMVLDAPILAVPAAATGPLQELFRPPRTA